MNREDRKKQLIAQGAVHRVEIILAKQDVQESLRPEAIARSIVQHAAVTASATLRSRNLAIPGLKLETILPLAMSAVDGVLKHKGFVKAILRAAAFASTAAGLFAIVSKKKKSRKEESSEV